MYLIKYKINWLSDKVFSGLRHLFISLALLVACTKIYNLPVVRLPELSVTNYFQIGEWQVAGPFKTNLDSLSLVKNNTSEASINLDSVLTLSERYPGNQNFSVVSYTPKLEFIDFSEISGIKTNDSYFYSSVIIKSTKKQEVTILSGNRYGMEIWLNGKKVLHSIKKEIYDNYNQYLNYTNVVLNKGSNLLLIRHYFSPSDEIWTSICHIASLNYSRDYYFRKSNYDLIKTNFVSTGSPLILTNRYYSEGVKAELEITKENEGTVLKQEADMSGLYNLRLPDLKTGIYFCSVKFPGFIIKEPFYYGNPDSIPEFYLNNLSILKKRFPKEAVHLEALRLRIKHLLKFKASAGQVTSYFNLDISEDGKQWHHLYSGESKSTNIEDCIIQAGSKFRFLRFTGRMNSANSYNNIAELEIIGKNGSEIKPLQVKSSGQFGKDVASNITDKDYKTAWSQEGDGKWVEFDLGSEKDIAEIKLAFRKSVLDPEIEVRLWQRKIVLLLSEAEELIFRSINNKDLYKLLPGRHLRGYISTVDGDTLNYMIQVPSGIKKGEPLPVILFTPIDIGTRSPFLVSMLAADILKDDKINIEVERNNMLAVVFTGNNYESDLMPVFYTEVNSILKDIGTDFPVDTTRIYLYGVCASSAKSLQYADYFPAKVAAISNVSAAFHEENLINAGNLFNIPLQFIHSKEDTHSPFLPLQYYIQSANNEKIFPRTIIFPNASHYFYANAFVNLSFDFFKDKAINYSPSYIHFSTHQLKYNQAYWIRIDQLNYSGNPKVEATVKNNKINILASDIYSLSLLLDSIPYNHSKPLRISINDVTRYQGIPDKKIITFELEKSPENPEGLAKSHITEGPINHFFANKFLIVQGSLGNKTEKLQSQVAVNEFKTMWLNYYYNDCKSKFDTTLTETDINEANLLLIGNDKTNSFINQIKEKLPVVFTTGGFRFKNTDYNSDHCIFMVFPNPLNPDKYILLAGGADISNIRWLADSSLFIENNDYVIFNLKDGAIVNSGQFNRFWQ